MLAAAMKFFILFLLLLLTQTSSSQSIIKTLPGFPGFLPFKLETGYIGVGDNDEVQLFYYFIESERDPKNDPLIIWLTGGPGCSGLSSLVYEIGPFTFDGSLPAIKLNPYGWTKGASIIFLDSPVGTGFSYSTTTEGYHTSDTKCPKDNHLFLRKWLLSHPEFLKNPLFVGGDSYGGRYATMLTHEIVAGNEAGMEPRMLLKGYFIGNAITNNNTDFNERVPFAHGMALISDEYFELAKSRCNGEYINPDPYNIECKRALELVRKCTKDIRTANILEPSCNSSHSEALAIFKDWPFSDDDRLHINQNDGWCRDDNYLSSVLWANDETVRESLHIRKGTKAEWQRCNKSLSYEYDVQSVFKHYQLLTEKDIPALHYSGDHDLVVPYLATLKTVRALNLTPHKQWRPWYVDNQVAGFTEQYKQDKTYLTFATVKDGGHTAPEYRPKECLKMIERWTFFQPL